MIDPSQLAPTGEAFLSYLFNLATKATLVLTAALCVDSILGHCLESPWMAARVACGDGQDGRRRTAVRLCPESNASESGWTDSKASGGALQWLHVDPRNVFLRKKAFRP
ncbi:MAG TPA: hypothetical protein VNH11_14830 [Pirellulales bacterium]|nr:hypothetical protein [Pirellulales bacterium]